MDMLQGLYEDMDMLQCDNEEGNSTGSGMLQGKRVQHNTGMLRGYNDHGRITRPVHITWIRRARVYQRLYWVSYFIKPVKML